MSEQEARRAAVEKGKQFLKILRRKFPRVGPDHPHYEGIEVRRGYFVQRHQGVIVGGAVAKTGERTMVAGGPVMGSPVSARPIYEALNAHGVKPSTKLTPYGRDAQRRAMEATCPAR